MNVTRAGVLVVDDQAEVLIGLEHLLEDEGLPTTAWSGVEALEAVDSHAVDLVLVNEYLPGMSAAELVRQLRRLAGDVPCIIMHTADRASTNASSFEEAGTVDVISKWPECAGAGGRQGTPRTTVVCKRRRAVSRWCNAPSA